MSGETRKRIEVSATSAAQLNLQPGQRLALRYQIRQRLSADGTGVLYRAVERSSGEELDIHVLPPRR